MAIAKRSARAVGRDATTSPTVGRDGLAGPGEAQSMFFLEYPFQVEVKACRLKQEVRLLDIRNTAVGLTERLAAAFR